MEHVLKAAAVAVGVRLGAMIGGAIAAYGFQEEHVATAVAIAAPLIGVAFDAMVKAIGTAYLARRAA